MSLNFIYFNVQPLHIAVQRNNAEMVKLLLAHQSIDVNGIYILKMKNIYAISLKKN